MKPALVVIDVQTALCRGAEAAFDIERVIERINALSERARRAGVPVFFVQHEQASGLLVAGSADWELDARLEVAPADHVIRKTASDAFHGTGLETRLRERGVTRLVICGLQSEFCVDSTVRRALALGFPVTPVADAHSTLDSRVLTAAQISAHHNETWANLTSYGVVAIPVPAAEVAFAG